jgi:general stress protein YciG
MPQEDGQREDGQQVEEKRRKPGPAPGSEGARRISEAHRGSHEHDKRGGFAADRDRAKKAGSRGGATVKERYGAEFYQKIGAKGGQTVREKRGREHFVEIGKIGGSRKGKRREDEEP